MVKRRWVMRRFLMRDIDRVFELRKNLIDDWKYRGLDWRQIDLPPKKWTLRRVGGSIVAGSKNGGVQWKAKVLVRRSGLTGILRSPRSRWSRKAATRPPR